MKFDEAKRKKKRGFTRVLEFLGKKSCARAKMQRGWCISHYISKNPILDVRKLPKNSSASIVVPAVSRQVDDRIAAGDGGRTHLMPAGTRPGG